MTAPGRVPAYVAFGLSSAASFWTAALLAVALLPVPQIFHSVIHGIAALVCHQRPERSFHVGERRLPVCARCTGLYLSGAIGALLGWRGRPRTTRQPRRLIVLAAVPTVVTLVVEWLGWSALSNPVRAVAALPLGASAGWLFVRMLRAESAAAHAL